MEYELFRSKLKPSVNNALVSSMIRSSLSGLHSHRTAVVELMIEGSIQARRERMFAKTKNSLRPDPTPHSKRTSEAQNMSSLPEVQPPAPAPQPPSQSLPNDTTGTVTSLASASAEYEASQDSSALSEPARKIEGVARCEEPPADVKTNSSPLEDFVELACRKCGVRQLRSRLRDGVSCRRVVCPNRRSGMKCVGCGTIRVANVDACTGCHRKFK